MATKFTASEYRLAVTAGSTLCSPTLRQNRAKGWATRDLLYHLQRHRKLSPFRFTQQQVHVLGHDNVPADTKPVPPAYPLQSGLEQLTGSGRGKLRRATIAGEGHGVKVSCVLIALQTPRHGDKSLPRRISLGCDCGEQTLLSHPSPKPGERVGHPPFGGDVSPPPPAAAGGAPSFETLEDRGLLSESQEVTVQSRSVGRGPSSTWRFSEVFSAGRNTGPSCRRRKWQPTAAPWTISESKQLVQQRR